MSVEYKAEVQEVLSDPENYKLMIILILFTFVLTVIHLFPIIVLTVTIIQELLAEEKDQKILSDQLTVTLIILAVVRLGMNMIYEKGNLLNISIFFISIMFYVLILANEPNKLPLYITEILLIIFSLYRIFPEF